MKEIRKSAHAGSLRSFTIISFLSLLIGIIKKRRFKGRGLELGGGVHLWNYWCLGFLRIVSVESI
jgi:hypothetical protein